LGAGAGEFCARFCQNSSLFSWMRNEFKKKSQQPSKKHVLGNFLFLFLVLLLAFFFNSVLIQKKVVKKN